MAWSSLTLEPFRQNPEEPYNRIRVLRVDAAVVTRSYYHPEQGPEPCVIVGCCEGGSPHVVGGVGGWVSIRRVRSGIAWLPAVGSIHGLDETKSADPDESLEHSVPLVQRAPLWFPVAEYRRFLRDAGLDPDEQIGRIPPLDARDTDRVLRHAYRRFADRPSRLPSWMEIRDLVLATECRPSDSPFDALASEAAVARMQKAIVTDVAGDQEGFDLGLVEHFDLPGTPEFESLAFRVRGDSLEAWAPVGNGCWGQLAF